MKMWKMLFYKEYTEIAFLHVGLFHDFSDLKCSRMFSDIPGKGMTYLQYVFSYDFLDNLHAWFSMHITDICTVSLQYESLHDMLDVKIWKNAFDIFGIGK